MRAIPKRFTDLVDEFPTGVWVALTPDRKLVAGMGATQQEAANHAKADYGLQNPILVKIPEKAAKGKSHAANA